MGQNGANQIALPTVALEKYLYFLNVDSFEPGRNFLGKLSMRAICRMLYLTELSTAFIAM